MKKMVSGRRIREIIAQKIAQKLYFLPMLVICAITVCIVTVTALEFQISDGSIVHHSGDPRRICIYCSEQSWHSLHWLLCGRR